LLVTDARVWPAPDEPVRGPVSILISDGLITRIGADVVPPAGVPRLSVAGRVVTAGFCNPRRLMENLIGSEREERGWAQAVLSEQLGVSRQTIVALETGKCDPSLPLAFRVSRLCDRPIEELFFPSEDLPKARPS